MSGKYGAIIKEARNPEIQITRKPDVALNIDVIKEVNLSIKVPENKRRHWASEAKRQGVTITAAITEALSKRFGEPQ